MLALMKCPHCQTGIHSSFRSQDKIEVADSLWALTSMVCPECSEAIIRVYRQTRQGRVATSLLPAYPQTDSMRPVPPEVPKPYSADFAEACAVLTLSPKASAAISRRNLQAILRDQANTRKKDLADQIDEVITAGLIPTHIQEGLDAVRNIGNFAAHPMKSTLTGEIVDVEPGEAEWDLDVLESLFDFYFVQPALTAKRRAALNAKLKDISKPPLK